MRRSTRVFVLATLIGLSLSTLTHADEGAQQRATTYGEALSDTTPVRIADLLASPESYLGETVRVEGLVDDVCPMKGCWIDILEEQSQETVRFKVQDDVLVFPAEAKGDQVVAEGVFSKRELSHEQAIRWMRHLAEEKDEPFDEASVTGPMVLYQIDGVGAEVTPR